MVEADCLSVILTRASLCAANHRTVNLSVVQTVLGWCSLTVIRTYLILWIDSVASSSIVTFLFWSVKPLG